MAQRSATRVRAALAAGLALLAWTSAKANEGHDILGSRPNGLASPSRAALARWSFLEGTSGYCDQQPRAIAAETAESSVALCLRNSASDLELSVKYVILYLFYEIDVS